MDPSTPNPSNDPPPSSGPVPPVTPAPPLVGDVPKDARTWGMLAHLSALIGLVVHVPAGNLIGPLVVWLIKKDEYPFVDDQGKEAVNFQITMLIAELICLPLFCLFGIGVVLFILVHVAGIILAVVAGLKANEGVAYRYPFAWRLIK